MINDDEFFQHIKTLSTEEILMVLEDDDPGQRNICLLSPEEGYLYTDAFILNDFEKLKEINILIELRREKLLEFYKNSLH